MSVVLPVFVTWQQQAGITSRLARFTASPLSASRSPKLQSIYKKVYFRFFAIWTYLEGKQLNKHIID